MIVEKIINEGEENEYTKEIEIPTEIVTSQIKILDLVIPLIHQIIQKNETEKIWICPECNYQNKLDDTKRIVSTNENPFFVQVVWDCPLLASGISNRLGFHEMFTKWFNNFLQEITWQEVAYRKEYKSQSGFDMDEPAHKDTGDSK